MNKEPFNLNKFMSGQPALTRDGETAYFVAYVPEVEPCLQLVFRVGRRIYMAHKDGNQIPAERDYYDLLYMSNPANPYADFKIDEPVMVRDFATQTWERGYFAGVTKDNFPKVYTLGKTKWTAYGSVRVYKEARRPTPEELKGGETRLQALRELGEEV